MCRCDLTVTEEETASVQKRVRCPADTAAQERFCPSESHSLLRNNETSSQSQIKTFLLHLLGLIDNSSVPVILKYKRSLK